MILVLMGVSGSGKSTIGMLFAERTGAIFADGDDYHPAANKAKMAAGHALDDADRQPWLEALNRLLRGWFEAATSGVLACSALKESYRETLVAGLPEGAVTFVLLEVSQVELERRLAARHHEFMNPALLTSQLQTLEAPESGAITLQNEGLPQDVVEELIRKLPR